jgi:hypothetical protein
MPAEPGTIYHLSIGPKTEELFRFKLTCAKTGAVKTMQLSTFAGWWLEAIVSEAQRRYPGTTIVPDTEMQRVWADVLPPPYRRKDETDE